jgi:hypothetical protein
MIVGQTMVRYMCNFEVYTCTFPHHAPAETCSASQEKDHVMVRTKHVANDR